MDWFIKYRPHLVENIASLTRPGTSDSRLLSLVNENQLRLVLAHMLDEGKFLAAFGLRSLSKEHHEHPFIFSIDGQTHTVRYVPGESTSGLFGGNSNWRGPIWFPVNYLMIESLGKFHRYYGDDLLVDFPTGSGRKINLYTIALEISHRLSNLFLPDSEGRRAFMGSKERFQNGAISKEPLLFHEYFHGDTGEGLGASHQCGWTALISKLIQDYCRRD
jgi:hypothetical protein